MGSNYNDSDDTALWKSVQAWADAQAFAELHRRFAPKLYALAYRKTGDQDVSEDLVQDLFVALWTQKETITIEKTIQVYLFSAIKNRIISHLRRQLVHQAFSLHDLDSETLVSHSANTVQDWIQLREVQEVYHRELENLPEKSRQVFELSRSGLTNKEIAELLGLAEKTIEFHITKCLRVLRVRLLEVVVLWLTLVISQ